MGVTAICRRKKKETQKFRTAKGQPVSANTTKNSRQTQETEKKEKKKREKEDRKVRSPPRSSFRNHTPCEEDFDTMAIAKIKNVDEKTRVCRKSENQEHLRKGGA